MNTVVAAKLGFLCFDVEVYSRRRIELRLKEQVILVAVRSSLEHNLGVVTGHGYAHVTAVQLFLVCRHLKQKTSGVQ